MAVKEALADPTMQKRLTGLGVEIFPPERQKPEALRDFLKAEIDKRADERDVKAAAKDADRAEQDAVDAIDYAVFVFYSARLAVLDALDARAYADERAKNAGS